MQIVMNIDLEKFIYSLQKSTFSKVLRSLELLEEYGLNAGMPHIKPLEKGLYELRTRGKQEIRIFFYVKSNKACLLSGFIKKTQKIPQAELRKALGLKNNT
jgi:phage-related protein